MEGIAYLQDYLNRAIPLSGAMEVEVKAYDGEQLVLAAPLAANYNHQNSAFGGSLYALAALAGWGLLTLKVREQGLSANIVIAQSSMVYRRPVEGDFCAYCAAESPEKLDHFFRLLRQRGRARLDLAVRLDFKTNFDLKKDPRGAADFTGKFSVKIQE